MKVEDAASLLGRTPHLRIPTPDLPGVRLWIKLEGFNPTGSIKDRACVYLIRDALESGRLTPGRCLLDASSGNMACAIAYFGRVLGYPTRVVSNSKLTDDKANFIRFFGADLELVGDFTIEGNRYCRELAEAEPERYCFLDQLHNWANPQAHYETTGPELLEDFPELSLLVASLGSGGSLSGSARFLKEKLPDLKVAAVEAASGTRLPGTGAFVDGDYITPFIQKSYDEGLFDHRVRIDLEAAQARTLELRDLGVFVGPQTGGVYHATRRAIEELGIQGDVVFLSGDSGWKNMAKLIPLGGQS